eukprot:CAMPEP_0197075438 /NCGR_PEP_ID=MMETSP1384-20130603/211612_1 /TAXON_ID=29189 /ORGANISM="Ammonia sp." /LENGTH=498 /DNA_ID=CAMNT_0042514283 /DNA_START=111 /DNA_END=1608 /DNA_ORIENTATION=-
MPRHGLDEQIGDDDANDVPLGYGRAEAECKEFFDDADTLQIKIKRLAELIRKSKHFVAFTGAGISTAAGIADFRSGLNTTLETGAGKWAIDAAVKQGKAEQVRKAKKKTKSTVKAVPSASHMALVELMTNGPQYLKYLISQNTDGLHRRSGIPPKQMSELHGNQSLENAEDGLHRRSGIPPKQMSELHGNQSLEICRKCGKQYMRDYNCNMEGRNHWTGRYCTVPACEGTLHDTLIAFKQKMPEKPLKLACEHTNACDLMLVLGSSLTVNPAAEMPLAVGLEWEQEIDGDADKDPVHNLVIVNLQKTDKDDLCSVRIFAKIDDVMVPLLHELGMDIPEWHLTRFVSVRLEAVNMDEDDAEQEQVRGREMIVSGLDCDGTHASIFTGVQLKNNGQRIQRENVVKTVYMKRFMPDEYRFVIPNELEVDEDIKEENDDVDGNGDALKGLVLDLAFYGHYREPNLQIQLNEYVNVLHEGLGSFVLEMRMNPTTKVWTVTVCE